MCPSPPPPPFSEGVGQGAMTWAGVAPQHLAEAGDTVSGIAQAWGGQESLVQQRPSLEASRLGPDTTGVTSRRVHCPSGPMRHVLAGLSEFLGDKVIQCCNWSAVRYHPRCLPSADVG